MNVMHMHVFRFILGLIDTCMLVLHIVLEMYASLRVALECSMGYEKFQLGVMKGLAASSQFSCLNTKAEIKGTEESH
jgi:hypothetical protein